MNENDKGGGRRRSSRRRGGRSSGKPQERGDGLQKQPAASSRMGEERQAPAERSSRPRSERARRGDRRSGQGDQQARRAGGERALGERALGERALTAPLDKAKSRAQYPDRPRWTPPRLAPPVLPKPECPRCGRPIEDLASAINDRETGEPTHFDCVIERIAESESLGENEKVVYIGGGRFGVVHFENPNDPKRFQIKKMLQWEEKEKRSPWRRDVADQYSAT